MIETEKGIAWSWGAMRDRNTASNCKHLQLSTMLRVELQKVQAPPIGLYAGNGKAAQVLTRRVIEPVQEIKFRCGSPEFLEQLRKSVDPDLGAQLQAVIVNLDCCSLCPYWQRRDESKEIPATPKGIFQLPPSYGY